MDYLDKPDPQTFIAHHGIKGQKWGVRRFQNEDGSLTEAGRKRYDVDIERAKAKENARKAGVAYNKATLGGTVYNAKAEADLRKAKLTTDWAKRKLASEKVKDHLNKQNGEKSERRLTLEKKYQEKGMSEEEAAIAAYKRVRTEKIIAATAGLTVAAATAYIAYKQYDKSVDRIIKAGTELQNISSNSNKGVTDAFYFSMTKGDNTKYRGLLCFALLVWQMALLAPSWNMRKSILMRLLPKGLAKSFCASKLSRQQNNHPISHRL